MPGYWVMGTGHWVLADGLRFLECNGLGLKAHDKRQKSK